MEDGGLQLTADKIDVSHESGDAFAHGNVKATWLGSSGRPRRASKRSANRWPVRHYGFGWARSGARRIRRGAAASGDGRGHFPGSCAAMARGKLVAGPVIVLDRQRQTLVARSTDANEPVRAVLLSAGGPELGKQAGKIPARFERQSSHAFSDSCAWGRLEVFRRRAQGGDAWRRLDEWSPRRGRLPRLE